MAKIRPLSLLYSKEARGGRGSKPTSKGFKDKLRNLDDYISKAKTY